MLFRSVIFAAGHSSRMGSPKALLEIKGKSLLQLCVAAYNEAGITDVTIMVNPDLSTHDLMRRLTSEYLCHVMENGLPDLGRSFSVWLAAQRVKGARGCFFQNIDNPPPDSRLLAMMMNSLDPSSDYVVPTVDSRIAHPLLVGQKIIDDIGSRTGLDWTLRDVLGSFRGVQVRWDDPRLLLNLNTPADWQRFVDGFQS